MELIKQVNSRCCLLHANVQNESLLFVDLFGPEVSNSAWSRCVFSRVTVHFAPSSLALSLTALERVRGT